MYRYFELILAMGTAWALSGILRFTLPKNRKTPDSAYAIAVIIVFSSQHPGQSAPSASDTHGSP